MRFGSVCLFVVPIDAIWYMCRDPCKWRIQESNGWTNLIYLKLKKTPTHHIYKCCCCYILSSVIFFRFRILVAFFFSTLVFFHLRSANWFNLVGTRNVCLIHVKITLLWAILFAVAKFFCCKCYLPFKRKKKKKKKKNWMWKQSLHICMTGVQPILSL